MITAVEILIDAVVFAIVAFLVLAAGRRIETALVVGRRVRGESGAGPAAAARPSSSIIKRDETRSPLLAWVQRASSLSDPAARQKLRADLIQAGFPGPSAPALYVVIRFGLAIGLPALFLSFQKIAHTQPSAFSLYVIPLFLSGVALVGPRAFIDNRIAAKQIELENAFPDALDLLVVCVEAGLALEAAFIRVGDETVKSHPMVSRQFQMLSQELRAGRSREEALRNLADRVQVDMVKSFVALLIQTDALGVSIAQSLRTYAQEMRHHRMLKAEERAMRIPVIMTAPIILCILPVIIGAVMLPAIIDMYRKLLPALTPH